MSVQSQKDDVAKYMLLYHATNGLESLGFSTAVTSSVAELFQNDPEPSPAEIERVTNGAIQACGYVTDAEAIGRQRDLLGRGHAGFWTGNYTIVDAKSRVHSLLVNSESIRLLLGGSEEVINVPSDGGAFAARRFAVDNDKVRIEFHLATSADGLQVESPGVDLAAEAARYQVTLSGTLTVKADSDGPQEIVGKCGVFTPAGVFHDRGEDPAWVWAGAYDVRRTDTELWEWLDDPLVITEASDALTVNLGARQMTDVSRIRNVVTGALELTAGVTTRVTIQLASTSGGIRRCNLWFDTTGTMRTLNGYASVPADADRLWAKAGRFGTRRRFEQALNADRVELARSQARAHVAAGVNEFCRTVYDSVFPADRLQGTAVDPTALFVPSTIKTDSGDKSGYKVDDPTTERVALFTTTDTAKFPKGATLRAFQSLDRAGHEQAGLDNCRIGVLLDDEFELPGLVETDFYEARFNLKGATAVNAEGLRFDLAIDDPRQPGLIKLAQPEGATCTVNTDDPDTGPDATIPAEMPDFTKGAVLFRGTTGETQNVGHHAYHLAVSKKQASGDPIGFLGATRAIYEIIDKSATPIKYKLVRTDSIQVPILLLVPIQMDSRDALEVNGDAWPPATRGKAYNPKLHGQKGMQPFTWRVVDDSLPKGLHWDQGATKGKDFVKKGLVSFGVNGTVDAGVDPGTTYSPVVRVMSDKSCVMKPVVISPQITVTEPDTEGRNGYEVTNVIASVASSVAALAALVVSIILIAREPSKKQAASDRNVEMKTMGKTMGKFFAKEFNEMREMKKELIDTKNYVDDLKREQEKTGLELDGMRNALQNARDELETAQKNKNSSAEKITRLQKKLKIQEEKYTDKEKEFEKYKKDQEEVKNKNKSENNELRRSSGTMRAERTFG